MNTEHHAAELQQLLKRGYSADDLRTLSAPADQIEKAVTLYREELQARARHRSLHNQAIYAMRLPRN